jgi:hypothetical protein
VGDLALVTDLSGPMLHGRRLTESGTGVAYGPTNGFITDGDYTYTGPAGCTGITGQTACTNDVDCRWNVGPATCSSRRFYSQGVKARWPYAYVAMGTNNSNWQITDRLQVVDLRTYTQVGAQVTFVGAGAGVPNVGGRVGLYANYAYVTNGTSGLEIFDISNPAAVVHVNTLHLNGYDIINGDDIDAIEITGQRAVLGFGHGFYVLNLASQPALPTVIGMQIVSGANGDFGGLAASAGNVFFGNQAASFGGVGVGGVVVAYDTSGPTGTWAGLGAFSSNISVSGMVTSGNTLLLMNSFRPFQTLWLR